MTSDIVSACPRCGEEHRVRMPSLVAERLRELTDECLNSATIDGHTVRVYKHAGLQIDGLGVNGATSFTPAGARRLAALVTGDAS